MRNQSGHGFLEMLLFAPLALLLLFGSVEGGIAIHERSVLRDALRSGMNAQALAVRDHPRSTESLNVGTLLGDSSDVDFGPVLDGVAAETGAAVLKALSGKRTVPAFSVECRMIRISLDPESGAFLGAGFEPSRGIYSHGIETPETALALGAGETTIEQFVEIQLQREYSRHSSSYVLRAPGLPGATERFLTSSFALAIRVAAISEGIETSPFQNLYQDLLKVQEFAIVPLRKQLG